MHKKQKTNTRHNGYITGHTLKVQNVICLNNQTLISNRVGRNDSVDVMT